MDNSNVNIINTDTSKNGSNKSTTVGMTGESIAGGGFSSSSGGSNSHTLPNIAEYGASSMASAGSTSSLKPNSSIATGHQTMTTTTTTPATQASAAFKMNSSSSLPPHQQTSNIAPLGANTGSSSSFIATPGKMTTNATTTTLFTNANSGATTAGAGNTTAVVNYDALSNSTTTSVTPSPSYFNKGSISLYSNLYSNNNALYFFINLRFLE